MRSLNILTCFAGASTACGAQDVGLDGRQYLVPRTDPNDASLEGLNIKILALGASSVYGHGSTDSNSFRLGLLNSLVPPAQVTYVGTERSGKFTNNQNSGYPGFTIQGIADQAPRSYGFNPDVIILHAGVNDMIRNVDVASAPSRLGNLIGTINKALPNALLIVANLNPNGDPVVNARINNFNPYVPRIVAQRRSLGFKVVMSDWASSITLNEIGSDKIHMTDKGYAIVANVLYNDIVNAKKEGLIGDPVNTSSTASADSTTSSNSAASTASTTSATVGSGSIQTLSTSSISAQPQISAVGRIVTAQCQIELPPA